MATHSSTLAGKFHGWRSLVGYSPWGPKELDTTEGLHFHFSGRSDWEQNTQSIFPEGRWVKGFGKMCSSLGSPSTNLQEWVTCSSWDGPMWVAVPPTFPHFKRLDPTARKQWVLSTLQGLVNLRLNQENNFFFPLRILTNFQRSLFWTELIQGALWGNYSFRNRKRYPGFSTWVMQKCCLGHFAHQTKDHVPPCWEKLPVVIPERSNDSFLWYVYLQLFLKLWKFISICSDTLLFPHMVVIWVQMLIFPTRL